MHNRCVCPPETLVSAAAKMLEVIILNILSVIGIQSNKVCFGQVIGKPEEAHFILKFVG